VLADQLGGIGDCGGTHQRTHGAVKSMPMVPPELGVGALERRVTVRLRLLDTVKPPRQSLQPVSEVCVREGGCRKSAGARWASSRE
jgi:hypothetical protein